MNLRNKFLVLLVFLFAVSPLLGQTKNELQKKRDNISEQIKITNQLLEETRENKNKLQGELSLITRKINLKRELIDNLNAEINLINSRISENEASIVSLNKDLEKLKNDYATMIRHAQRNRSSYDRLMYIFASDDFYQALRRLKYMQEYTKYRKRVSDMISETQEKVKEKIKELEEEKKEKSGLLQQENAINRELDQDRKSQLDNVTQLQKQEKKLKSQLSAQEQERKKLNNAIQKIIEEEIRLAKKSSSTGTFELTPEAKALSENFESNKGKLPWPVERGVVTSKFGEHPHPVIKGIMVNNNGIDIATSNDAMVRAVFKGTVTSIFTIPGAGLNVIISHGAYRTVYANLKEVFVEKGQEVDIKQVIGTVMTNERDGKTETHLEIWKISGSGTAKQNPELWLYKP